MSRNANAGASPRSAKRSWWEMAAMALGALVLGSIAAQYLAGVVLLAWLHRDVRTAGPLTIARYAYYYGDRADVRHRLWIVSWVGLAGVSLAPLALVLPQPRSLHGDARFATRREIERAGLFAPDGIFLGRFGRRFLFFGRRYLILGGQQGAIVCAAPRKHKGTAVVVPNGLFFRGSLLCQDPKLENWRLTAGYRQRIGQECYLVNPFDPDTACSNPLSYVSSDPRKRISGLQRTAATLFPEVPGTDPFWTSGGRGMFLGLGLYVLETPSLPPTVGEVLRQGMATVAEGFSEHWKRIISGRQSGRFPLSPQCVRSISDIMDLAPVTASSIRKTFTSRLDLWSNPLIDAATSRNDFDWRDLRRKPMSIYLGFQPGDLNLLRPLFNLHLEQAIACQTDELPEHNPALKHQVLMLLDETTAPGRIPILAQAISYLPGYNVRLLLVIQAYSQLREVYGANAADTMMKSLAARVLYAPKDYAEANEISLELGMRTVRVKSVSQPRAGLFGSKGQRAGSVSVSEQKRPLLLPQEVKELSETQELVLYEGLRPILARKNRYYEDPFFRKRLFPPPSSPVPGRSRDGVPGPTDPSASPGGIASGISASDASAMEPDRARTYPGTAVDIERIDSLTLEDFAADFDRVKLPEKAPGERLTPEELQRAVDSFLDTLRSP